MSDTQIWAAALGLGWLAVLLVFGGYAAWAWWDIDRHETEREFTARDLRAMYEEGA